jgi:signal transduction histidine kinase
LARARRPLLGLRGRLVVALVLTSAVTLGVAAVALFVALDHRLRLDERHDLRTAALEARGGFEGAGGRGGVVHRGELRRQAHALSLRTGARVTVFDRDLQAVADTDPDAPLEAARVRHVLGSQHTSTAFTSDGATVVVPMHIAGSSYVLSAHRPLTGTKNTARSVARAFAVAAGAGLLTALGLGVALAGALVRRLRRLRDTAGQLALEGLDAPPPDEDRRDDEIGQLAQAFASMRERLRREEAARRAFVATASHELRTPLASLQGTLELIAARVSDGTFEGPQAARQIALAGEQSARLGRLASSLLDLSRIERGLELRDEPVDLIEVCRAVASEFEHRDGARAPRILVEQRGPRPWGAGDPSAVAQIVRILVENALRYAPPGEPVRVTAELRDGRAIVAVQDAGPGVARDEREHIFGRFQRGRGSEQDGGVGLGLAIGRELARGMHGELELDPAHAPGARFVLWIVAVVPAGGTERLTVKSH